ncbi:hypothetical protein [Promicromonospora sp. NPDC060271]|uniref:hypothetical protein n=1 Tax=Promicromonospora sp. NPDC060271 TaxID=3347089 RepID=UPI0036664DC4
MTDEAHRTGSARYGYSRTSDEEEPMTGACGPPAPGSGDPATAFAAAVELLTRGADQLLAAAVEVDWEAPAAELYRADVAEAARAVARDISQLREAMSRVTVLRAWGGPG